MCKGPIFKFAHGPEKSSFSALSLRSFIQYSRSWFPLQRLLEELSVVKDVVVIAAWHDPLANMASDIRCVRRREMRYAAGVPVPAGVGVGVGSDVSASM